MLANLYYFVTPILPWLKQLKLFQFIAVIRLNLLICALQVVVVDVIGNIGDRRCHLLGIRLELCLFKTCKEKVLPLITMNSARFKKPKCNH